MFPVADNLKDFIRYWAYPVLRPRHFHAFGVDLATIGAGGVWVHLNTGDGTFDEADSSYSADIFEINATAADLDGDGDVDLSMAISNTDSVLVLFNTGDGTFDTADSYPAGDTPHFITASDLDGDGDVDLATTNIGSEPGVSVLLNTGDGTFDVADSYPAGINQGDITAADLNGDGFVDLALNEVDICDQVGSVFVLLNTGDGTGTFEAAVSYPVSTLDRTRITVADLDGDGDIGLATANYDSDDVSVLLNTGTGTFAATVSYPAGTGPNGIIAADLNGDGFVDLALVTSISLLSRIGLDVSVLLNTGDGTFSGHDSYSAGSDPFGITAADLDGDGDVDLTTANHATDSVSVLLNTGDGTFDAADSYPAGNAPVGIIAADLDGDGDVELATVNWNSSEPGFDSVFVPVFFNRGDGAFATAVSYTAGVGRVGDNNWGSITAADLDGDGDLDLAHTMSTSNEVSILYNGDRP